MDPTATLQEIRKLVDAVKHCTPDSPDTWEAAQLLAVSVRELDEHMARGGFKPRQWDQATS